MEELIKIEETPEGIKFIYIKDSCFRSLSLGVWVKAGTVSEKSGQEGWAHLVEHMVFKGTQKYSWRELSHLMDSIGGRVNAFTHREFTCYYGRVLPENLSLLAEILGQLVFHPVFPAEELEREKQVVLEEIKMNYDDPEEYLHDVFLDEVWDGHPAGKPILGKPESVLLATSQGLKEFWKNHYTPGNVYVTAVGNLPDGWIEAVVEKFEMSKNCFDGGQAPLYPPKFTPGTTHHPRQIEQIHVDIGYPAVPASSKERYKYAIFSSMLGQGMSSLLFQRIREELGLVYNISTFLHLSSLAGILGIYFACSPSNLDRVMEECESVLAGIVRKGVPQQAFELAKARIRQGVLMAQDDIGRRTNFLGESFYYLNRVPSIQEIIQEIEAVEQKDMVAIAQKLLNGPKKVSLLGPVG